MDHRFILYHKQSTSARTRFVKFAYNSVCAPEAVPPLAQLLDTPVNEPVTLHPAAALRDLERQIGFTPGSLEAEGEYREYVEIPGNTIQVFLARITTIDPPFEEIEKTNGCFIDLTQARGLPTIELDFLRKAYELVLGG